MQTSLTPIVMFFCRDDFPLREASFRAPTGTCAR